MVRSAATGCIAATASLALGCSGSNSAAADLPPGWEGATPLKSFSQAACSGSPLDPTAPAESIDVTAVAGSIHVAYHHAQFRCEQAVEGFVRADSNTVAFLVQPKDMNPSNVAKCDCLYEITMGADTMAGRTRVDVYRRWDHVGGNRSDPVKVGTVWVTVP
jgi:hypothetical protein